MIVNTKAAARSIFELAREQLDEAAIQHLSTDMCPAHRKQALARIRIRLDQKQPTLCVSTQLIEAGVDVDFRVVIRFLAGLDSIAQAAGRCNRNGAPEPGVVHVVNPAEENLGKLPDILVGREKALRVLDDYRDDPSRYRGNLVGPAALNDYYRYYFFDRAHDMSYPLAAKDVGHDDTLLNLLAANEQAVSHYAARKQAGPKLFFRQAFMTAAKAFKAIDAPTQGVVVPHGKAGQKLIADLYAAFDIEKQFKLLRAAQQYTVNVFPHMFEKLRDVGALHELKPGSDLRIFCLDQRYYSHQFGLSTEPVSRMESLHE